MAEVPGKKPVISDPLKGTSVPEFRLFISVPGERLRWVSNPQLTNLTKMLLEPVSLGGIPKYLYAEGGFSLLGEATLQMQLCLSAQGVFSFSTEGRVNIIIPLSADGDFSLSAEGDIRISGWLLAPDPELIFETGSSDVSTGVWTLDPLNARVGEASAKSGNIYVNGHKSWLEVEVGGSQEISFFWKVSCYSSDSIGLRFYVDGSLKESLTGEVNWTQVQYSLGTGNHTLRWEYYRGISQISGEDAGWIDLLRVDPPFVPLIGDEIRYREFTRAFEVRIEWDDFSDDGYLLQRFPNENAEWETIYLGENTFYDDVLTEPLVYKYRVMKAPSAEYVVPSDSNSRYQVPTLGLEAGAYYQIGIIRFLKGKNRGLSRTIRQNVDGILHLMSPFPFKPEMGDEFEVFPGCDKRPQTCRDKFNNKVNFKGFVYIPNSEDAFY